MGTLDEQVWTAHGDAWQAEGRLRARLGGGARGDTGRLAPHQRRTDPVLEKPDLVTDC